MEKTVTIKTELEHSKLIERVLELTDIDKELHSAITVLRSDYNICKSASLSLSESKRLGVKFGGVVWNLIALVKVIEQSKIEL